MKNLTKVLIITGSIITVVGGGYLIWDKFIREEPKGEGEVSADTKKNKLVFTK